MPRVTQLTDLPEFEDDDIIYVINGTDGSSKKGTLANLRNFTLTNPYRFRAHAQTLTTLTDGVNTKVLFDTVDYDPNGNFTSSTYTVPVDGTYHFDSCITTSALSTPVYMNTKVYVNGASTIFGTSIVPTTTGGVTTVHGDLQLEAGDTVEIYCLQNTAGNEDTVADSASTWVSGHLVSITEA